MIYTSGVEKDVKMAFVVDKIPEIKGKVLEMGVEFIVARYQFYWEAKSRMDTSVTEIFVIRNGYFTSRARFPRRFPSFLVFQDYDRRPLILSPRFVAILRSYLFLSFFIFSGRLKFALIFNQFYGYCIHYG